MFTKDVICVMPTGSGKSLIFQLPAYIEMSDPDSQMVSIFISPLVALTRNLQDECEHTGLAVRVWKQQDGHSSELAAF
ncbi:hypothetical protein LPJ81_001498, partial [Coemansia sp. IMI 209127]